MDGIRVVRANIFYLFAKKHPNYGMLLQSRYSKHTMLQQGNDTHWDKSVQVKVRKKKKKKLLLCICIYLV